MQNALKTAIHFYHMSLQNMSWEGYVNTGIKYPKETDSTFLLYELLFMRNISDEAMRYGYEIEKCQENFAQIFRFMVDSLLSRC